MNFVTNMKTKLILSTKKKLILILIAVITVAIISGSTLAYFAISEPAENIITSSNISLLLHDELPDGTPFPEEGIHNILPGRVVDKIVYVENDSDNPEWIRIHLFGEIIESDYCVSELTMDGITVNINTEKWIDNGDGWYYYTDILKPGEKTEPLFTQVTFSTKLSNDYMDATVYITPYAQSVQSVHNGKTVLDAKGWPYATIDEEGEW